MRVLRLPPRTQFPQLSKARAAELLGLGKQPLLNLQAMQVLDDLRVDRVTALAAREWAVCDSPLAVVRPGRPDVDADGRLTGYHVDYEDESVLGASRKWFVAPVEQVLAGGHLLVSVSTFVVALLQVTGLQDTVDVLTDRGTTVRRNAFAGRLLARVDDLVAGTLRHVEDVPGALEPLLPLLGHRLVSPPGAPLLVLPPYSAPPAAAGQAVDAGGNRGPAPNLGIS